MSEHLEVTNEGASSLHVIPAQAGICPGPQFDDSSMLGWIPAYAGMTVPQAYSGGMRIGA